MAASVYEQFEQLSPQEQQYITANPYHAFAIKKSRTEAFEETKKRFGFNGHNDKSDAFRHCFWSAVLTREIGYSGALRFTTAHESSPLNPKDEMTMDMHNNAVGLGIGREGSSNQILSQRCMAALLGGQLKVLVK